MLHLVSKALCTLLYPFTWTGIFIPVLPARLLSAMEAPCPYIIGIERRYDRIELPDDDFVLVDLDENTIQSTAVVEQLPRQQRRKLVSLLQLSAPHHNRFGVPTGPPAYATDTFPFNSFCSENPAIFTPNAPPSTLAKYVSLNSTSFGAASATGIPRPPLFNAFLRAKADQSRSQDRPPTGSTYKGSTPPSPQISPSSSQFPTISRSDTGFALANSLRKERSGHFDNSSKRSSSVRACLFVVVVSSDRPLQFGVDGAPIFRRPSIPFSHHASSLSTSTLYSDSQSSYKYAPSTYAQSTIAASTIMPNTLLQPVRSAEGTIWAEGHCLQWHGCDDKSVCSVCEEKAEEGIYRCSGEPIRA